MTDLMQSPINGWVYPLGWALIHFLWQGALGALVLSGVLRGLRDRPAESRYMASLLCLVLLAIAPWVTAVNIPLPVTQGVMEVVTIPVTENQTGQSSITSSGPAPSMAAPSPAVNENVARGNELERQAHIRSANARYRLDHTKTLLSWVVLVWLTGVVLLSIHHLAGWLAVERLRKRYVEPAAMQIERIAADLCGRLGISKAVQLMHSAVVDSPVTIGWIKPVILLPASVLTGLTPRQLEAVLAHELAHIQRHDYLINLLQTVVETVLFYHPAVWWISKQIRIEREHCCDDIAVVVCGDAVTYVQALAEMEQLRMSAGFAMAAKSGSLLERVHRLATRKPITHRTARDGWWVGIPAMLLVMGLVVIQFMPLAQSTAEKEQINPRWCKTLPCGVVVELIGISPHPSNPDSWWKPDETPLIPAPYMEDGSRVSPQEKELAFELAVQLRNLPEEFVPTRMETIPRGSSAGGGSDVDNAVLPHTRAVAVVLTKDRPDCDLRVEVAAGKWEKEMDYMKSEGSDHWPSSSHNGVRGSFAFAPPLESGEKTFFTLTHSLTDVDYRVVAIDTKGEIHQTVRSESQNVGPLIQTTSIYDMRLIDIVRFEIQQRPYEEALFLGIPLKVIPPASVEETIPGRVKQKFNPKYFLSFPLLERRAPTAEEEALLTRILDRHRQIKDVRVILTQNSFSLVTRQKDEMAQQLGFLPIPEPARLHLPEDGLTVATIAGDIKEHTAHFVRSGDHWWADISQLMGMPGITQTGFDGNIVWFRFGDKVEIIPASKVNTFNIFLAAPMGLKMEEGEARQNTVYLGMDDCQGPCHVFAQGEKGCLGSDDLIVHHYYFTQESLVLKKIETFYLITGQDGPIYISLVDEYTFDESLIGVDESLFQPPKEGVLESKEIVYPKPGELTVGLSDASNGNVQASYRLKYEGGTWGSGLY